MPNDPMRVEISTSRECRRRCSAERKLALVEETLHPPQVSTGFASGTLPAPPGMMVSAVARQHGVSPSLLFRWRQLMSQGGQVAVSRRGCRRDEASA